MKIRNIIYQHKLGYGISYGEYKEGGFFVYDANSLYSKDIPTLNDAENLARTMQRKRGKESDESRRKAILLIQND